MVLGDPRERVRFFTPPPKGVATYRLSTTDLETLCKDNKVENARKLPVSSPALASVRVSTTSFIVTLTCVYHI